MTFLGIFDKLFLNQGGGESLGLLKFRKCLFLTCRNNFFAEKHRKKSQSLQLRLKKIDIRDSILFETVKTIETSHFNQYDDRYSQPWL